MSDKTSVKRADGSEIIVDRDICIGASSCLLAAKEVFELDNEQKAVVIDADADSLERIIESAQSCPVDAITVKSADGKVLWPSDPS